MVRTEDIGVDICLRYIWEQTLRTYKVIDAPPGVLLAGTEAV